MGHELGNHRGILIVFSVTSNMSLNDRYARHIGKILNISSKERDHILHILKHDGGSNQSYLRVPFCFVRREVCACSFHVS